MSAPIDWNDDVPGADPAVEIWRATGLSTGAQLRAATEANSELAMEHAKCVAELERIRASLKQAYDVGFQVIRERDAARDHNAQLRKDLVTSIVGEAVARVEANRLRSDLEISQRRSIVAHATAAQALKERDEALTHTEPTPQEQP